MRASTIIAGLLTAGFSAASPIEKRVSTPKVNDGIILNYALTLGKAAQNKNARFSS